MSMRGELLSTREAAERLGVSDRYVRRLISQGQLKVAGWKKVRGGRTAMIGEEEIEKVKCERSWEKAGTNSELKPELRNEGLRGSRNKSRNKAGTVKSDKFYMKSPQSKEWCGVEEFGRGSKKGESSSGLRNKNGENFDSVPQSVILKQDTVFEDNEWWIGTKGLRNILFLSERGVRKQIQKGKFSKVRKVPAKNKEGFSYQVGLSSLSDEYRRRFFELRFGGGGVDLDEFKRLVGVDFTEVSVSEEGWRRISVVADARICPTGVGRDAWYESVAKRHNVSKQTVYRYLQLWREKRLFEKKKTRGGGELVAPLRVRVRSWDVEAVKFAVGVLMNNRFSLRAIRDLYGMVKKKAQEEGWRIGSEGSFYRIFERLPAPLRVLRDKGRIGLAEEVVPKIVRDVSKYHPMEVLCGDQHRVDFLAVDDLGNPLFLELFLWMDMRSRMCWFAMAPRHYNRYTVGLALREAMRFGLPKAIYTDWGKAENAKYIRELRANLAGGIRFLDEEEFLAEVFPHQKARAYHAWAKPTENIFAQLERRLKGKGIPGFARRDKDNRVNFEIQRAVKELLACGKVPNFREVVEVVTEVVWEWNYHALVKPQVEKDRGKSPFQIYREEVVKAPVAFLSESAVDWCILPERRLKPHRSMVEFKTPLFGKRRYFLKVLGGVSGKVRVKYDPYDASYIYVLSQDGEFLGMAEEWRMVDPRSAAEVSEKIRVQQEVVRYWGEVFAYFRKKAQREMGEVKRIRKFMQEEEVAKEAQLIKANFESVRKRISRRQVDEALIRAARALEEKGGFAQ